VIRVDNPPQSWAVVCRPVSSMFPLSYELRAGSTFAGHSAFKRPFPRKWASPSIADVPRPFGALTSPAKPPPAAAPSLTPDDRTALERAGEEVIRRFVADAGIGETLVYNRLVAALMSLHGVLCGHAAGRDIALSNGLFHGN
jgi:hypothetical protein